MTEEWKQINTDLTNEVTRQQKRLIEARDALEAARTLLAWYGARSGRVVPVNLIPMLVIARMDAEVETSAAENEIDRALDRLNAHERTLP